MAVRLHAPAPCYRCGDALDDHTEHRCSRANGNACDCHRGLYIPTPKPPRKARN